MSGLKPPPRFIAETFHPGSLTNISNHANKDPLIPKDNLVSYYLLNIFLWGFVIIYTFLIIFGEWLILPNDESIWCQAAKDGYPNVPIYPNPDTNNNPCYRERTIYLLGLTQFETDFSRRMISSVILGSAIGYERKAADRPAGVRTMALVCLGSCFFTMCGQHAFRDSPQTWDAARVSAAIPSGVGFLGSALIWKHTMGGGEDSERHEVHGLTTAASVWLSASVGIGTGGRLYLVSVYAVILVMFVLRLGPRMYMTDDTSFAAETESEWDETEEETSASEEALSREEQRQMLEDEAGELHNSKINASLEHHQSPLRKSTRRQSQRPVFLG